MVNNLCLALVLVCLPGLTTYAGDSAAPPKLLLPDIHSGESVNLSQYQGQVVYVDFWASWCGPCRQSLPLYDELQARLADQPFQVLAVNLDEDPSDGLAFLARHPVRYSVVSDPNGESAQAWKLLAMPSSYLIDKSGALRQTYVGFEPSHMERIENDIHALLNEIDPAH